jgi:hypothetical protein
MSAPYTTANVAVPYGLLEMSLLIDRSLDTSLVKISAKSELWWNSACCMGQEETHEINLRFFRAVLNLPSPVGSH